MAEEAKIQLKTKKIKKKLEKNLFTTYICSSLPSMTITILL